MTVVEYDGAIVVVDTGLRFPTAEMIGIDLVLPDFTLPARARRRHRGDRHHPRPRGPPRRAAVGPARARPERHPRSYGGPLTMAMARSKLDEHQLQGDRRQRRPADGEHARARARSTSSCIHMTHSIPDACAVALTTELGTVLITGDYKFDQTPVDGTPADVARLAELGREGVLLLCGDSTNADRPGFSPSESIVGPHLERGLRALRGPHRRHVLRVEHPPRPAGRRRRRRARPQGRAGRPLDAQERQHRPLARPHRRARGHARAAARDRRLPRRASSSIISTGSPGRAAAARCAAWPTATTRRSSCTRATPSSSRATPIPGNERAVNETIDRLYHIGCDVDHDRATRRSTPPATATRRRSS